MLAYNCSPSFNWKKNLDDATVAKFQRELGAMGYKFQFITLAGFHSLNYSMFNLAHGYAHNHMTAFVELQEAEFAAMPKGFTAVKHQREVGTSYFDAVTHDDPGQPGVDDGAQGLDRGRAVLRKAESGAARRERLIERHSPDSRATRKGRAVFFSPRLAAWKGKGAPRRQILRAARPATLRTFFAVWPGAEGRDAIAAVARDVAKRSGGVAPRPENHHLTLAFVGEIAPDRLAALEQVGAASARASQPFTLSLDRVGAFHYAGIAWLGASLIPEALEHLVAALRDGLASERFPVEARSFRAHVTLARRSAPVAASSIEPIAFRVERMTLCASELTRGGSIYRELAGWPLGNAGRESG